MSKRHTEELCQAVLDGTASRKEALDLQETLRADADARRIYLEYAALQESLDSHYSGTTTIPSRWSILKRNLLPAPAKASNLIPMLSALAAVVAVMLAVWIMWPQSTPVIAEFRTSDESLYTITGTNTPANTLQVGSKVTLNQGVMELNFKNGTKSYILGPASFSLISQEKMTLETGRVWFKMGEGINDFQVITEKLEVKDLGTEFGVYSSPIEPHEVHVFDGAVEVNLRSSSYKTRTLHAGNALSTTEDHDLISIPCSSHFFPQELTAGLPSLHFSLDHFQNNEVTAMGSLPEACDIIATWDKGSGAAQSTQVPGVKGQAIQFNGRGSGVIHTNWPGFAGNAPRTVTLWINTAHKSSKESNQCIVGWGDYRMPGGKWKMLLTNEYSAPDACPRISFGAYAYDAPIALNDGKWHHVAMSYTGKNGPDGHPEVAIHVDGVKQKLIYREYPELGNHPRTPNTLTQGQAHLFQIGGTIDDSPGFLTGAIDEIYIYSGVLSDKAIRKQAKR